MNFDNLSQSDFFFIIVIILSFILSYFFVKYYLRPLPVRNIPLLKTSHPNNYFVRLLAGFFMVVCVAIYQFITSKDKIGILQDQLFLSIIIMILITGFAIFLITRKHFNK